MIGVKAVNDDHEIMMITDEGIIIQIAMDDVSIQGRNTSGVKLMNLDEDVKIAQIAKVREKISGEDGELEIEEDSEEAELDEEFSDESKE